MKHHPQLDPKEGSILPDFKNTEAPAPFSVAKLCSYCGITLERDDARFCQNCGKSTSSHSLSPAASVDPASSAASSAEDQLEDTLRMSAVKKSRKSQPSLPEQIAQQPWSHKPVAQVRAATQQEQARPTLREQVAVQPPALEEETAQPAQPVETFSAPSPRTEPPAQELHAEIADQHVTEASAPSDAAQNTPVPATSLSLDELPSTPLLPVSEEPEKSDQEPEASDEPEAGDIEEDAVEDLPTLLLESSSAEALASDPTDSADAEETQKDHADGGNKQSTRPAVVQPIPAKFSAFPDVVSKLTSPLPSAVPPIPASISSFPDAVRRFTSPLPALAQSLPARLSALPAAMRELTSSIPALPRTRQRLPMPVVASVLVALVLIGVGSWLVFAQPFSVPQVTQPLLGFSDAHLGLSLLYPNGWTSKKDASDSTVQFYDRSQTAQVIIAVSNINNSTITAALQKQSAQLGMSGAKSVAPLAFAGASWQAMQGSVQQNSASYTCTVFATTHANRLVIWTQLAPQSVYSREESVIFSAMRQSLRFV